MDSSNTTTVATPSYTFSISDFPCPHCGHPNDHNFWLEQDDLLMFDQSAAIDCSKCKEVFTVAAKTGEFGLQNIEVSFEK